MAKNLLIDNGSHLQVMIPVILITAASLLPLIARWAKDWQNRFVIGIISLSFFLSISLFNKVMNTPGMIMEYFLGHSWDGDRFLSTGQPIGIVARTDPLGALMLILVTGIGLIVAVYSLKYISHEIPEGKESSYYTLFLLLIAGMTGICLTGDYFNFYVFLEVASISSYALVAIPNSSQSLEAGFKYLIVGAIGSALIVLAIALIFSVTGTLNMHYASQQITKIFTAEEGSRLFTYRRVVVASMSLFIVGFSIKSALIPMHAWLVDAHPVAPSSISAMLSGLVVKVTGVFIMIRFLYSVFGVHKGYYGNVITPLFMIFSGVTIVGASVFAIAQTNLKRMLAFSTVAQLGYIVLGIGLVTQGGLTGSVLHIINHALIKTLLFLCAGAIIYKTGIKKIEDLGGIGFKMPITMACFTVGAMAMVGVPPLNGFMSKWALAVASGKAGYSVMIGVLMISSLLNAIYYFRVVAIAYFGGSHAHDEGHSSSHDTGHSSDEKKGWETPLEMLVPLVLLAGLVIMAGVRVDVPLGIITPAVGVLFR